MASANDGSVITPSGIGGFANSGREGRNWPVSSMRWATAARSYGPI
jgi:hypothetical protein